ncbi:MAG: phenylacetate-CoA oxygenase subunit PaaC [Burkholderiales bacterium]|nr:phenylacetate-CoA oxygenase subunit PaaC [Burkholderiales bacterium]
MDAVTTTPALDAASLLRLGDNALILGQRLSELCGHGPVLEEDIATTNIALDLIGQARLLLALAGQREGRGRDEDALAFLRDAADFRNVTLVELPNGDFAQVMLRVFLMSSFQVLAWEALSGSNDADVAGIAVRSVKEARYHAEHSGEWVIRLGDGTDASRARMLAALDALWPYTAELFVDDAVDAAAAAAGTGVVWASLQPTWRQRVEPVLAEATLPVPAATPFRSRGRFGVHSEHLGHLLAGMQQLHRAHPGATW